MDSGGGASDKAAALASAREKERLANEAKRSSLEASTAAAERARVNFSGAESAGAAAEAYLRERTIGLLTREDYLSAKEDASKKEVEFRIAAASAPPAPRGGGGGGAGAARSWGGGSRAPQQQSAGSKRSSRALLSFGGQEEEDGGDEGEEEAVVGKAQEGGGGGSSSSGGGGGGGGGGGAKRPCASLGKDPGVATSFLPDAAREAREGALRKAAEEEWGALQERIKQEPLTVVYSYWDGTGHRRELSIPKGASIGKFLDTARADLVKEFPEMRAMSASSLLYVKEDLIIPHHHTFYELITTEARGKSGPLFAFGAQDDLRLGPLDARVEKEDSHPGKILDARWYQRNKHIFPYSRWEVFQPGTKYESYTIS